MRFHHKKSTGKIWHALPDVWKKKEIKVLLIKNQILSLGPKNSKKFDFAIGIQQGKYGIHFRVF